MNSSSRQASPPSPRRRFLFRDDYRLVPAEQGLRTSYLARTMEVLAIDFPSEYVERAEVLALLNQNDILCGGVMLVTRSPFRSIEAIPFEQRPAFDSLIARKGIAEINGLWLAPEMKSSFLSISFWGLLTRHLAKSKKSSFLFTYDTSNSSMKLLANWLSPTMLYSGITLPLPGMQCPSEESIALVDIEPIKTFLARIERCGIVTAETDEEGTVSKPKQKSQRPQGSTAFGRKVRRSNDSNE